MDNISEKSLNKNSTLKEELFNMIYSGYSKEVKQFLKNNSENFVEMLNDKEFHHQILEVASQYHDLSLIKLFNKFGVNLYSEDNTLFKNAILHENSQLISYLFTKSEQFYHNAHKFLHLAIDGGKKNAISTIFKNILGKKYSNKDALVFASSSGDVKTLDYLIKKKNISVNFDKGILLTTACEMHQHDSIAYLLKEGADPNIDDGYALTIAAYSGNLEVVKILVENGAKININKNSAIFTAIDSDNVEIVDFLYSQLKLARNDEKRKKKMTNVENNNIFQKFKALAYNTFEKVMNKLAENARKKELNEMMRFAITTGNAQTVEYFLNEGGDINIVKRSQNAKIKSLAENRMHNIVQNTREKYNLGTQSKNKL